MKIRFYEGFSFSNILISLLIVNLIVVICCPIHIGMLYFFKIPISNILFWKEDGLYVTTVFIPTIFSFILTIWVVPFVFIASLVETFLIKLEKIPPKEKVKFSKKKTKTLSIILIFAILAYLISLGGWIHTMIPYSPAELEQLRYD